MARIICILCFLVTVRCYIFPIRRSVLLKNAGKAGISRLKESRRIHCQIKIADIPQHNRKVKAVVTDVDGTLFNSKHTLGPSTHQALITAMEQGVPVIMATGKSRGPWVKKLRESLGLTSDGWNLNGPSVFIQGLMVCDSEDRIVFSRLLSQEMVREMDRFAAERNITVIAYTTDDRIVARKVFSDSLPFSYGYTAQTNAFQSIRKTAKQPIPHNNARRTQSAPPSAPDRCSHAMSAFLIASPRQTDAQTDRLIPYSEPTPQGVGAAGMAALGGGGGAPGVYKMILMAEEPVLAALRAAVEAQVRARALLTPPTHTLLPTPFTNMPRRGGSTAPGPPRPGPPPRPPARLFF